MGNFHNFDVIVSARTFLQSVFGVYKMSDAENPLKRSFRRRQISNDEGYLSEKLLFYKKKRSGYVRELTKTIIKIEKCLVNTDDSKINNYDKTLEETISKIRNVTTRLNNCLCD